MKNFLLLLAIMATSVSTIAQRNVDIQLVTSLITTDSAASPSQMDTIKPYQKIYHDNKTRYYFAYIIKNLGPDTLLVKDSLIVKMGFGETRAITMTKPLCPDSLIGLIPIFTNSHRYTTFTIPSNIIPPFTDTVSWCDTVWVATGVGNTALIDPDFSNNYNCQPVQRHYQMLITNVNTVEAAASLQVYPNPATHELNVAFDAKNEKNIQLILRDAVGRQVYMHSFANISGHVTHSLDISYLPAGVYTVEVLGNGNRQVERLVIQPY